MSKRKTALITVRADETLWRQFKTLCEQNGTNASDEIRAMISARVNGSGAAGVELIDSLNALEAAIEKTRAAAGKALGK